MTRAARALAVVLFLLLALGGAACAKLLGIRSDRDGHFEHRAHVLRGIACTRCHSGMDHAEDTGPLHTPGAQTCTSCHNQPHETGDCLSCHASTVEKGRAQDAREHLRFSHAQHLSRSPGTCVRCHAGVAESDESLAVPMSQCLSCHTHADQFQPNDCAACHIDLSRELVAPSEHLVHDADFSQHHGVQAASSGEFCSTCHTERFCAGCHGRTVAALPRDLALDRPMTNTLHAGGFMARHPAEAHNDPGLCTTCHTERFCVDCHQDRNVAPADGERLRSPHPANWVSALGPNEHGPAARRDPVSCASCHGGGGESLCVSCHKVGGVGGSPHPTGWSSDRSLSDLPCRMCHEAVTP